MKIQETIDYLMQFGKSGKPVKDLSRIRFLLNCLDNPQNDLKFIHIAGTNGKGSVLETISYALINAGYKTAQFTSPFIRRYTDRIRINGNEIPLEKLNYFCNIVSSLDVTKDCSQFEITLAIALLYFKSEKCDVVLLETGIGGLLDASNVIENPLLSVITSISLDHTAILGDTIEKIATQKAGIIKPCCAVVTDPIQPEDAIKVILKTAKEKNSRLIIPDKNEFSLIDCTAFNTVFSYNNDIYKTSMAGIHQFYNAQISIKALEYLRSEKRFEITDENIKSAVENARVEGRIQILRKEPTPIYLDGGHNAGGALALSSFVEKLKTDKKKIGIVGLINTKDYKEICRIFDNTFDEIICVDGFVYNEVKKEELQKYFLRCKTTAMNIEDAYNKAINEIDSLQFFCGSLYAVSKVLELNSKINEVKL
jgi:dihydrofolate synthase/folylpolyglutamate synthase